MRIRVFVSFVVAAFACQALVVREAAAAAPARGPTPTSNHEASSEAIVVPAGTTLVLVAESTVSSASAKPEDVVLARLADDVKSGEETLLPAGSEMRGYVTSVKRSGKVKGKAELHIHFDTIEVKGRSYRIEATPVDETAGSSHGRDAKIIGGAAGAGALIGGVASGGAGLLKGILIGGAAGTGGVLFTRGKEVVFEQGSRHSVTLESSLRLR
jgi:hypothetical protein